MPKKTRSAAASVLGALVVVVTPSIAAAAPSVDTIVPTFYGDNACATTSQNSGATVCLSDNSTVTYWFESQVTAKSRDSVRRSMDGLDTTDLSTSYDSTPVDSGSGETDVMYRQKPQDFPVGSSLIGQMWCNDAVSTYRCDQAYINFKIDAIWALACHETGHAIGLHHGRYHDPRISSDPEVANKSSVAACMTTPIDSDRNTYGSTNVANINYVY